MPYPNCLPETAGGAVYARENNDEFETSGLIDYWRILRRHRGIWIVFAFAGALLGLLIALPQTPVYRARTSVEILELNDNFLNFKQVSPVSQTNATLETADIQTQMKILQSESLLARVVAKMHKTTPTPEASGRISAWRKVLNLSEPSRGDAVDLVLKNVAKSVTVHASGQTRIIAVNVDS